MTLTRLAGSEPAPPMVSLWTDGWMAMSEGLVATGPTSGTWEAANRGVWFPVSVPSVCVVRRMWWANGATVTGNVEAGVYLDGGHKPGAKLITTGSVGQATTNAIQFGDITDTTLTPQLYWLFISCSSTSATFFRSAGVSTLDAYVGMDQDSIGPGSSPSTATPVERQSANVYLFGFSTTTIT